MSHQRKNSVRGKVIDKKWIYLDRDTLHRQNVGHLRRQVQPWNMAWLAFTGWIISQANEWLWSSQGYGFSSSPVWMWELDYKESWAPKNWCFWTVVLEKTLESHLDCKEIQPVHPKGDQSWVFIGRTDAEPEQLQHFGHLMGRTDSFEKTLMLEKIAGRRRKGWQDEMVGWYCQLNGHERE